MRRSSVDSPKVAREKIEHPQMSPLHEMKTAQDPVSDRHTVHLTCSLFNCRICYRDELNTLPFTNKMY